MNAKTLEAVTKHGNDLLAIFPNATERDPVALCKKLRRIETRANKYATDQCNGHGPSIDSIKHEEKIRSFENTVCNLTMAGFPLLSEMGFFINMDPRGYALKLDDAWTRTHAPHMHRDWGGYGILAPDLTV